MAEQVVEAKDEEAFNLSLAKVQSGILGLVVVSALVTSSLPYKLLVGVDVGQEQAMLAIGACYVFSSFAIVSIGAYANSHICSFGLRMIGVNVLVDKAINGANGEKAMDGAIARLKGKA